MFYRRWNEREPGQSLRAGTVVPVYTMKRCCLFVSLFLFSTAAGAELRIANLLLSPEQKPNVEVVTKTPINGSVSLSAPEGWKIVPETITATSDLKRFVFTVAQGRPNEQNVYALSVKDGTTVLHRQEVRVATAPNSNIDVVGPNEHGITAVDWSHAIPNSVTVHDKQVRIHTVWNRKRLSLLVGIDDMKFVPANTDAPFTAVQFAVGSVRSDKTFGELYQFLLFADATGKGRLVSLNDGDSPRNSPDVDASKTFVWKHERTIWFETAIPFAAIPSVKPGEGRELTLSFLLHDADGKMVLDWGRTCLLPNENDERWCRWQGDSIGNTVLSTPRSEWGLCSSKF